MPKETKIGILVDKEKNLLIVQFDHPVKWVALTPDLAKKLARRLKSKAKLLRS